MMTLECQATHPQMGSDAPSSPGRTALERQTTHPQMGSEAPSSSLERTALVRQTKTPRVDVAD